ncbi:MAG: sigma-70 family RNA polymerase sigma factor [Candidatus Poribacteria bacterium]|nr:sigma-70 family RNA polymerase sigma factor [Candidatus Poribacteria bacterium]
MLENDVQLIYRVLSGDDSAFSTLVEKHQKGVHALVWRKIGDFHHAEEITQDTFIQVYKKLGTLKDPKCFCGWLYVIANRLALNWLKRRKSTMPSLEDTPMVEIEESSYQHYMSERRETEAAEHRSEVVKNLLNRLPESERTVLTLHYLGEMTAKEISKYLGVSVSAIKGRLRRGRERLKASESLVSEVLGGVELSADLTARIMREVADITPVSPPSGKPVLPWAALGSAAVVILLMIGASNQYLARFQKPYSFEARSEPTIEIIDTDIVLDTDAKPDVRHQIGQTSHPSQNRGDGMQPSSSNAGKLLIERTITQADGLASNTVLTIFEDSQGALWFGTADGITRYDGDNFQTFTMEDGLPRNTTGLIFEDRLGMLWFGDGMLANALNRPKFIDMSYMNMPLSELANTVQDETTMKTQAPAPLEGISRYDGQAFRMFTGADGLIRGTIQDMFEDKTGTLWFATDEGMSRYEGEKFSSITVNGPTGIEVLPHWWNQVTAIAQDTAGNLWFGSHAGITYYNLQTSDFRYLDINLNAFKEMGQSQSGQVTNLLFDAQDNLWITQEGVGDEYTGIRRYDGKELVHFPQSEELPMNKVDSILRDTNGNLWFAGSKKLRLTIDVHAAADSVPIPEVGVGVSVYNGETFQNISTDDGLPSNRVWSVFEDSQGKIWFATDAGAAVGVYSPSQKSPILLDPVVIPNSRTQ